eukprot:GHRR01000353.1.p1 GENE.GHRR01000353.1~~GHRR01000353.1.p1  ORF type:complete len:282 (+),score=80.24 GHRR01000353.1:150-995(+)
MACYNVRCSMSAIKAKMPVGPQGMLARRPMALGKRHAVVRAGSKDVPAPLQDEGMTGIIFQPFEEVQGQLSLLDQIIDGANVPGPTTMSAVSLARHDYDDKLEAAINEQINVEYNMSYIYHSLSAFMDRDNVGLPGFAAYFKHQSDEEREHANLLMVQQNRRGGRVKLQTVLRPESEFVHEARGEAIWSLELSLALEKLNFGKLRELHAVAEEVGDSEMQHYIEDYLLHEQAKDVKASADLVSRARRAGPGHGIFHLDLVFQREYGYGLACEDAGNGTAAA